MGDFLYPSLAKPDKYLYPSHASFTDLGLEFQLINLITLPYEINELFQLTNLRVGIFGGEF